MTTRERESVLPKSNLLKLGLDALGVVVSSAPSTYATKTLAVCRELVEIASVNKQSTAIVERALDVAKLLTSVLATLKVESKSALIFQINQFLTSLERLANVLTQQAHRNRLTQIVRKSHNASVVHTVEEDLNHTMSRLSIRLQAESIAVLDSSQSHSHPNEIESILEQKTSQHRSERLDVISRRFREMSASRKPYAKPIPPCPQILFGRECAIESLVCTLQRKDPCYVAILGPGGIGKTALGVTLLHHQIIKRIYGPFIWFLACEVINDSSTLTAALASIFDVDGKNLLREITDLAKHIDSKMLIMLDNFETPWEPTSQRTDVEALLSKLTRIPKLSVLITLRGSERPAGVLWSEPFLPPLETLDPFSAEQAFLAVSGKQTSETGLAELLNATACLPLAVVLLASQAQFTSCSELLDDWYREKTSMISRGLGDRLSSLDVSVKVSLSSERLRNCPDAFRLLQLLSILPDGADPDELELITPQGMAVARALSTLLQVALAYRDNTDRIRVLSPIMEHIGMYAPIGEALMVPVLEHYSRLGTIARENTYKLLRFDLATKITCQLANVRRVLEICMESEAQCKTAALTSINIAFFSRFGEAFPANFIASLLSNASRKCREFGFRVSLAHSLVEQASIGGYLQSKDISRYLDEAIPVLEEASDNVGLCNALITYAVCLLKSGDTSDAAIKINAASALISNDLPQYLRVRVHGLQASLLQARGLPHQGIKLLESGINELDLSDCPILSITMQLRIASWNHSICRLEEAARALERLLGEFGDYEHAVTLAWEFIGAIYLVQSRLTDAEQVYKRNKESNTTAMSMGRTPFIQRSLAEIHLARGDLESARIIYESLLQELDPKDLRFTNAYSATRIGPQRIAMAKGEFEAALMHVNIAHSSLRKNETFPSGQMTTHIARADWFLACGLPSRAISDLVLACLIARKFSDIGCFGMAIQRLGDVYLLSFEDIVTAKSCYELTQYTLQGQNLRRHFADSTLRLGVLLFLDGKPAQAYDSFEIARQYFQEGEDPAGCYYCDALLDECVEGSTKCIQDISSLPLGTFLGSL